MNEMSDSREVYESKPSKIVTVFIYMFLSLLIIALAWMYFGRIDIVVKSSGMIRPNDNIGTVKNAYAGKIEKVYVEDSDSVAIDEMLYVVEHKDLLLEKEYCKKQINDYNEKLELIKRYKKSIQEGKNYFTDSELELEYFTKYETYKINLTSLQKETAYNSKDLKHQKEYLTEQIEYYQEEIKLLKSLLQSVQQGKNLFSKSSNSDYYNRYLMYKSDYVALKKKYQDTSIEIQNSTTEEETLNSFDYYTEMESNLVLLQKSIQSGEDKFSKDNTYHMQYKSYVQKRKELQQVYKTALDTYETNKELKDIAVSAWEVEQSCIASENAYQAITTYKNTTLQEISTQIDDVNQKLSQLSIAMDTTLSKDDLLENNRKGMKSALDNFKLQYTVELEEKIQSYQETVTPLEDKLKSIDLSKDRTVTVESADGDRKEFGEVTKFKNDELEATLLTITSYEDKLDELATTLEKLNQTIDSCYVKANCTGIVNTSVDLVKGNMLEAGIEVLTIVPEGDTEYKAQIYVSNNEIGKIEVGMPVKLNIYAYPNSEYGYLTGTITKVLNDIKVDSQSGDGYYLVEATLDMKGFYEKDGRKVDIKAGMSCEAKVITGEKRIIRYILEKLELLVKE